MDENQVLELVEFYEDMIEKQDEIIVRQSRFIKSLATELSHLRNMLNVEASEDAVSYTHLTLPTNSRV